MTNANGEQCLSWIHEKLILNISTAGLKYFTCMQNLSDICFVAWITLGILCVDWSCCDYVLNVSCVFS